MADLAPSSPALDRLAAWLASAIGAGAADIAATRLSGGAVQENWLLVVEVADGPRAGMHKWVLRTDAAARIPVSLDRTCEYEVIRAARANGVKVAEPVARCEDASVIGAPFFVQGFVPGSAHARRLVRDAALAKHADSLASDLGRELALVHCIAPGPDAPACLPTPMLSPARAEVARLRHALDGAGEARPALEYILGWLNENAPPARPLSLVHGDYRTGNYMVDGGRLAGVLDWEFAHWGDADEDIGWLTAPCWRFGGDSKVVGGIAELAPFLSAYEAAAARKVSPDAIAYWQILASAKWATIAVLQGDRWRKGGEARLELMLTGLMPPEMEHDALSAILAWTERGGPQW